MSNVTILSSDKIIIPTHIQNEIRSRFSLSKNKEIEVKYCKLDKTYDCYINEKYICSF